MLSSLRQASYPEQTRLFSCMSPQKSFSRVTAQSAVTRENFSGGLRNENAKAILLQLI